MSFSFRLFRGGRCLGVLHACLLVYLLFRVKGLDVDTPILTSILDLIEKALFLGGSVLAVFGGVTVGTNLKDHNGPAITGGILQIAGGVLIIACGVLFSQISVA